MGLPDRYNVGADLLDRNLKAGRGDKIAIHSAAGDVTYSALARLASSCFSEARVRDFRSIRESTTGPDS